MATTNENAVSKQVFDDSTAAWQALMASQKGMINNTILAKLFNVPLVDLQEIISEMLLTDAAVSSNAYIGLQPAPNDASQNEMRLYFVGVDAEGVEIYERPDGSGGMESAIYDMVLPCPPTCR